MIIIKANDGSTRMVRTSPTFKPNDCGPTTGNSKIDNLKGAAFTMEHNCRSYSSNYEKNMMQINLDRRHPGSSREEVKLAKAAWKKEQHLKK